jgi:hypothetical protein
VRAVALCAGNTGRLQGVSGYGLEKARSVRGGRSPTDTRGDVILTLTRERPVEMHGKLKMLIVELYLLYLIPECVIHYSRKTSTTQYFYCLFNEVASSSDCKQMAGGPNHFQTWRHFHVCMSSCGAPCCKWQCIESPGQVIKNATELCLLLPTCSHIDLWFLSNTSLREAFHVFCVSSLLISGLIFVVAILTHVYKW